MKALLEKIAEAKMLTGVIVAAMAAMVLGTMQTITWAEDRIDERVDAKVDITVSKQLQLRTDALIRSLEESARAVRDASTEAIQQSTLREQSALFKIERAEAAADRTAIAADQLRNTAIEMMQRH